MQAKDTVWLCRCSQNTVAQMTLSDRLEREANARQSFAGVRGVRLHGEFGYVAVLLLCPARILSPSKARLAISSLSDVSIILQNPGPFNIFLRKAWHLQDDRRDDQVFSAQSLPWYSAQTPGCALCAFADYRGGSSAIRSPINRL
mgnify:CR=1 FL=1